MNKLKSIYSLLSLKLSIAWLLPAVGLCFYVLVYTGLIDNCSTLGEIMIKAADVLVIGGVVGFLTNIAQTFGIFRKAIEDAFVSNDFLEKRKDISTVWRNASKILFNKKFPDISDDLLTLIEDHYICRKEHSYYNDFHITTNVKWTDDSKEVIKVEHITTFELITEKKGRIKLPLSAWMKKNDRPISCDLKCCINGREMKLQYKDKEDKNTGETVRTYFLKLKNKEVRNKYQVMIHRSIEQVIKDDFDLSFRAAYIVKNMTVKLSLPENLSAKFICRGTVDDFICIKDEQSIKEYLYRGLVLQRQGYTFALQKK
ncbi:MAG: hypothetical protein IJ290_09380 [Bacteroidaceae bacterium]|nr:hypothetical protein [Bacteroidaceae bacterium]